MEIAEFRIYALDVPAGARSAYWLFTFAFEQPGFVLPFIEFEKSRNCSSQVHTRNDLHLTVAQYAPSEAAGTLVPQLYDFAERFVCVPVSWWVTNDRLDNCSHTEFVSEGVAVASCKAKDLPALLRKPHTCLRD